MSEELITKTRKTGTRTPIRQVLLFLTILTLIPSTNNTCSKITLKFKSRLFPHTTLRNFRDNKKVGQIKSKSTKRKKKMLSTRNSHTLEERFLPERTFYIAITDHLKRKHVVGAHAKYSWSDNHATQFDQHVFYYATVFYCIHL